MRNLLIGALFLWAFGLGNQAQAVPKQAQDTAVIQSDLAHLAQSIKEYNKDHRDLQQAKGLLADDILFGEDRAMMKSRIAMDRNNLAGLGYGMWDDIFYLKDHWSDLTQVQKDSVDEAKAALE